MRLVTVFAFTENVTVREKDSSMSSEMNVSLLLSYFCGKQNGGWGHDGDVAWALSFQDLSLQLFPSRD